MSLRLTKGEMVIWAAAFVSQGAGSFLSVEVATRAVQKARRMARELDKRKDAVDPEAAFMLREMVNRDDANREEDDELGNVLMWLDHRRHKQVADLLRAEYGIFWEDGDDYTNGSLGPAGLATQLDIRCPGCGSQAVWLRSQDGRRWCCGNIDHIGFKFEISGVEATRAKEWYAKWLEEKVKRSALYGHVPPSIIAEAVEDGLDGDDFDDEDPVDDLRDDDNDFPVAVSSVHGQGFREELTGRLPNPEDPLDLAGGPFDPGKFGR